ncbi:MAG: malate dehydrogenase [Candidatus Cloacimonadota bacterium]|nr:MAG: malate dehydrogenase [Candidatus Cloacimonadota bacterium]
MKKVTVVGGGNVGATAAQRIAERELADVVLIDILEGMPQGKSLDMFESSPIERFDCKMIGSNTYDAMVDSDIVVITAGLARKPGMDRLDLLKINQGIVAGIAKEVKDKAPNAIIILVTNPLDVMSYVAMKASGFPKERVIGMAGVLDAARMSSFIAENLNVSSKNISSMVLGGHGDEMVPLPRFTTVGGIPITELMDQETIDAIIDRTKKGGAEIVKLLKTGSAYYAPSASAVDMVESILRDQNRLIPASVYLEGEYGINGVFCGVPCTLGKNGLTKIFELNLTEDELASLKNSASLIKAKLDEVEI